MMKIIADSSSNMCTLDRVEFQSVPLKINAGEKEYVDTPELDLDGMLEDLRNYRGKSGTSCPNFQEWTEAFRGADTVFAVTITSKLSGSYSSAAQAAQEFQRENPEKKIIVVDSRSAGPGQRLLVEKLQELILQGLDAEQIQKQLQAYRQHNHLLFSLESLHNLAQNGRCSHAVARVAGVLGIRLVGDEQDGDLHPLHKCRGEKKALDTIFTEMENKGLADGCKVRIAQCRNLQAAETLKAKILTDYPHCDVQIEPTTALCSFYAEQGGLIVGYEDDHAAEQ